MRGIGGPLLCIGDLLSDVGEDNSNDKGDYREPGSFSSSSSNSSDTNITHSPSLDLTEMFQENYNQLNQALAGNDHSWTALTLKLCSALETADKLVQSTNSNISQLTEKVGVLQSMVSRGDAAVKDLKVIHDAQCKQERSSTIGG